MKFRFWSSFVLAVFLPLCVVFLWGMHFISTYKSEETQLSLKNSLQNQQLLYSQILKSKILALEQGLEQSLKTQTLLKNSPISELMLVARNEKNQHFFYFSNKDGGAASLADGGAASLADGKVDLLVDGKAAQSEDGKAGSLADGKAAQLDSLLKNQNLSNFLKTYFENSKNSLKTKEFYFTALDFSKTKKPRAQNKNHVLIFKPSLFDLKVFASGVSKPATQPIANKEAATQDNKTATTNNKSLNQNNKAITNNKTVDQKEQPIKKLTFFESMFLDSDPKQKTDFFMIGLIKKEQFLNFVNPQHLEQESKDIFLSTQEGRVLVHNQKRREFKRLADTSQTLSKIKSLEFDNNPYVESYKQDELHSLAHVYKVPNSNIFLVSKEALAQSSVFYSAWLWKWLFFCSLIIGLIFLGLLAAFYPVYSAYHYLKYVLISFSKNGEFPSWGAQKNKPYLKFYKNRYDMILSQFEGLKKSKKPLEQNKNYTFRSLLEEECQLLQNKYSRLTIEVDLQDNVPLFGFTEAMRTILHQLLLNAVESMGAQKDQKITVSSKHQTDKFIFSIKDHGNGLLLEDYEKVFDLYYSSKSQLGVGLNLTQALVQAQKGTIEFFDHKPKGLEVQISLPSFCFTKTYFQQNTNSQDANLSHKNTNSQDANLSHKNANSQDANNNRKNAALNQQDTNNNQ